MSHSRDEPTPPADSANEADAAVDSTASRHNKPAALPARRVLQFTGSDCAAFLQGYLTCDTTTLEPDRAVPGALCNLQGRVVANGWVWGEANAIQMLVNADVVSVVGDYIEPYRRFSRTTLLEPALPLAVAPATPGAITLDDQRALMLVDRIEDAADATQLWDSLELAAREVCVGAATSGQFLPQMLGLVELGAIDFDKGCYLGQEVVARAQHRGSVKRRLYRARLSGAGADTLKPGAELQDENGRWAGTLINVQHEPGDRANALVVAGRDLAGTTAHWAPTDAGQQKLTVALT